MKVKYLRLSKEEKKQIRSEFYLTEKGQRLKRYTNISFIFNVLLFIYCIYIIIDTYNKKLSQLYYVYGFALIAISIIMMISIRNLRIKMINKYLINTQKNKK